MSVLLVMLLLGVVQVAVFFYARNVAAASAADGARFASAEGLDPRAGGLRAEQLISERLDDSDAAGITCTGALGKDVESGLRLATVECRGQLHLLFLPIPVPPTIDVRSSALQERAP
jgi:Flp pilus assembly protein TadG